ncbi:bromo adjacent homology domain, zinc finger, RING/FYVE/PHD-type containing protein, partial [Tanacetum coccineum]
MRRLDEDGTYVALVRGFQSAPKVRRFYRPEDTVAGRKPFHGSRELFLTDHYDSQEACTIEGKCIVHSFTTYTGHSPDYVVTPNDYFSCSEYQTETGWFLSDAIEVVKLAENCSFISFFRVSDAKNPDHPVCLNMTDDQAKQLPVDNYTCDGCRSLDGSEGSASTDLSM